MSEQRDVAYVCICQYQNGSHRQPLPAVASRKGKCISATEFPGFSGSVQLLSFEGSTSDGHDCDMGLSDTLAGPVALTRQVARDSLGLSGLFPSLTVSLRWSHFFLFAPLSISFPPSFLLPDVHGKYKVMGEIN